MDGQPGGMAEESVQGDFLFLGERVFRHFPGDEPGVHVLIEGELALFDQSDAPRPATDLLIEPAWKSVEVVTGASPPFSVTP